MAQQPPPRTRGRRAFDAAGRGAEGLLRAGEWALRPLRRMYRSAGSLDRYGLVHMASVAGDAMVAIALADSVFFSLPVGQAKIKVALYLALTMAPLAIAAPALVPLLDRGGFRRLIEFGAAAGRALVAVVAAPHFHSLFLFPAAFLLLALSRVHSITKNGLTAAYAPAGEGLVVANGRLGRLGAVAGAAAVLPGLAALRLGGSGAVLSLAALAYVTAAFLVARLPQPVATPVAGSVAGRGRIPSLATPAAGAAGLRAASGFLLFLLAFALRRGGQPPYWFGALAAGATAGVFVGDVVAPRLPQTFRDEAVVVGSLLAAGAGGLVAFEAFKLPVLVVFALLSGAATELGRLAFQSLMQVSAPAGSQGRVFVRYEMAFQLSWVAGAFLPALVPLSFRAGILALAAFYILFGAAFVVRPRLRRE